MIQRILILFLFLTYNCYSQRDFDSYKLSGKIKKVEIFEIVGDSSNEKEVLSMSKEFDKNGFETSNVNYNSRTHRLGYNQKSYITKNDIITYKCECANTTELEKKFKIKDEAEIKKEVRFSGSGNGGGDQPSTVEIKKLDNKRNIISIAIYSENGYNISTSSKTYDSKNRVIKEDLSNNYIVYSKEIKYDEHDNVVEEKMHIKKPLLESKEVYTYDSDNILIGYTKYENDVVKLDEEYKNLVADDKVENIVTDKLKNTTTKKEAIYYNPEHKEIKKISFSSNGEIWNKTENEYFDNGNLKSKIYYKNDDSVTKKIFFVNDKNNNWKEKIVYESITLIQGKETKTVTAEKRYIQRITYSK